MNFGMSQEKAEPRKCEGRLRIKMRFAFLPRRVEDRTVWWERYVSVEQWLYASTHEYGEYCWYSQRRFLRWHPEKLDALFKELDIRTGVAHSGNIDLSDSIEYTKVYNYLDWSAGPISRRSKPEILWFKIKKDDRGNKKYL